jgi:hypothetical protein
MEVAKYEDNMTLKSVYFASHTAKKRDYFKQIENSDRDQKLACQVFLGDKTASRVFMRETYFLVLLARCLINS